MYRFLPGDVIYFFNEFMCDDKAERGAADAVHTTADRRNSAYIP